MKRKEFTIESGQGHTAVKYAWNAAVRHVRTMIIDNIRKDGETWRQTAFEVTERNAANGKDPERGYQIWRCDESGVSVMVTINRTK